MIKKIISVLTALVFFVSMVGCVTTNPDGSPSAAGSAGLGALMGAAGGALIGGLTGGGKGALKGALIGAAVGGLTGFVIGKSREETYKSAQQIYQENPKLAQETAKNDPPTVSNVEPCIFDENGKKITNIKNGQWVELGTRYQLNIPKYSDTQEVEVVEYNTLVASDGKKMDNPELTRTKMRSCGGNEVGIQVKIPDNLPAGNYTHIATVKIGDDGYKREQQIHIAKSNNEIKFYANSMRFH